MMMIIIIIIIIIITYDCHKRLFFFAFRRRLLREMKIAAKASDIGQKIVHTMVDDVINKSITQNRESKSQPFYTAILKVIL